MRKFGGLCAGGLCVAMVTSAHAADLVVNGAFDNTGTPWNFSAADDGSSTAGVEGNGPTYTYNAPDHGQVAHLVDTAIVSQTLTVTKTGNYTFSFDYAASTGNFMSQGVTLSLTDTNPGFGDSVNPGAVTPTSQWQTDSFMATLTAGRSYKISFDTFATPDPLNGDAVALIDNVSAPVPSPEPASLSLAAIASFGFLRRRR